jgi:dethiobiotin synthetase/adenosylmethionine--8-amino-7-oxononanoate aminotransferase
MRRCSSLYRNLLTYQLYGANTDVGKTIFATILSKAFAKTRKLWYLKPVSTGPKDEADDVHVTRFAKGVETRCLWQFGEAVSPHIAASVGKNSREVIIFVPHFV